MCVGPVVITDNISIFLHANYIFVVLFIKFKNIYIVNYHVVYFGALMQEHDKNTYRTVVYLRPIVF